MANELNITTSLRYSKNGVEVNRNISTVRDVTGDGMVHNIQAIGATEEALVIGDVGISGYILLKNLSTTATILVGRMISATFESFVKLLPGDSALLRLDDGTSPYTANDPYAISDIAGANLEYWLIAN